MKSSIAPAVTLAFFLGVSTCLAAPGTLDPRAGLNTSVLAQTCKHYQNRARFLPRTKDMALEAKLADSCTRALYQLRHGLTIAPFEAKRARLYLERLTTLKTVVIKMNQSGFAQARGKPSSQFGGAPRATVSVTGEYLIARHIGVLDRYREWVRASGFQLVAD